MPRTKCAHIDPRTGTRCHRNAKYMMHLTLHEETSPRNVLLCATCDKNIGRKRLMELGWSLDDAIKWEKNPDRTLYFAYDKSNGGSAAAVQRTRTGTGNAAMIGNTRY